MIGHVTTWGIHCGLAKHLSYWLPHLPPERHSVMLAEEPPHWYPPAEDWPGPAVVRCWKRGQVDVFADIKKAVDEFGVTILHLQWDPSFFPWRATMDLEELAAKRGVKIVITAHVLVEPPLWVRETNAVLRSADQVVAGTPALTEALMGRAAQFHFRPVRPIRTVPLPVPEMPPRPETRQGGGPFVLTWGLLGAGKGHVRIYHACRMLRERGHSGIRYAVMGHAVTREQEGRAAELEALIAQDGDMLSLKRGFASDAEIAEACYAASVIVLGHNWTRYSSSGTVAISVASGTPVVVSESPMFSGYVEEGAVRVCDGTPEGIADAIVWAVKNHALLAAGRDLVMPRITGQAVARQYEMIYQDLEGD